jgi:hypothetical protein
LRLRAFIALLRRSANVLVWVVFMVAIL